MTLLWITEPMPVFPSRISSVLVVTEGNTALSVGLATEKFKIVMSPLLSPVFSRLNNTKNVCSPAKMISLFMICCRPSRLPNANTFLSGRSLPDNQQGDTR